MDRIASSGHCVIEKFLKDLWREEADHQKTSRTKIIFVSFEVLRKPKHADVFITGRKKPLTALRKEINFHIPATQPPSAGTPIQST